MKLGPLEAKKPPIGNPTGGPQINMMDYHIAKLTPNAEYYCIVPTFYSVDVEKKSLIFGKNNVQK
jgi:hypothetical protein